MPSALPLIMMGTGPFAVPTFKQLYAAGHNVALLVTRPLRVHRGKEIDPPSPLRAIAAERGTPIFDPEDINAPAARQRLTDVGAELLVVCDYGQILKPETLAAARRGGINLHGSLLPKYRGAAPINWALYNGDSETGVTVIHITPKVDAGPCIARTATPIQPDETAIELEVRLAESGGLLMRETLDRLIAGQIEALPQDQILASKAPRLKKTDGAIDWTRPALAIKNQIRAFEPWPKTYTFWYGECGTPVRIILGPIDVIDRPEPFADPASGRGAGGEGILQTPSSATLHFSKSLPGTILEASGNRLIIAAGQGAVAPRTLQFAGKRPMSIAEVLRGHKIQPGERFGPEV